MRLKKRLLEKSRLYLVIDKKTSGKQSLFDIVNKVTGKGVDIIQLRDKESKREVILKDAFLLHKLLLNTGILFIVNDHLDIAKIVDSDGLHIGQDDTSIELARRILGQDKIIGVSCHNLKQAIEAQKCGADYLGIGPIFSTPTKPEYKPIGLSLIGEIKEKIKIPFFLIGNINQNNISSVLPTGVKRVAICRAILKTKNISFAVKNFSKSLE